MSRAEMGELYLKTGEDSPQEGYDNGSMPREESSELKNRWSRLSQRTQITELEDEHPDPLDEDAYGAGIASLIRDTERFLSGTEYPHVRQLRLATSIIVVLAVIGLQLFLLEETRRFIVQPAVISARRVYDKYEMHMYGCNETKPMGADCLHRTFLTKNNKHRGHKQFFDIDRFKTLDVKVKKKACNIPLSQPLYFGTILMIWTLTCLVDMNRAWRTATRLIWYTPTIDTMRKSLGTQSVDGWHETDGSQLLVIGLTKPLKAFVAIILVVRQTMTAILLWLGCRWLAATPNFSDILLNAVALEFVLMLKELLYNSMVSLRSQRETANTLLLPVGHKTEFSFSVQAKSTIWGIVAMAWVVIYITWFQRVLPQYNWDVHEACRMWIAEQTGDIPDTAMLRGGSLSTR